MVSLKKCEKCVILIRLANVKCHLRGCHRNVLQTQLISILARVEGVAHFFELPVEHEQLACFSITIPVGRTVKVYIERRYSVSSKVQVLAVCCESGPIIMLLTAWCVFCCNAAVFFVTNVEYY